MKYRANLSPFHSRRHVGDYPTFEAAARAGACAGHAKALDGFLSGGGSVVVILETPE